MIDTGGRVIGRVVSGGQSGVDRAALAAAVRAARPHGGWVPAGGWAEDRPDPPGVCADYPLVRPTPAADPAQRTAWNARDADLTVLVWPESVASPGCAATVAACDRFGRPWLRVVDVDPLEAAETLRLVSNHGRGLTVNVAGPRESQWPGAYDRCLRFLLALLKGDEPPGPA